MDSYEHLKVDDTPLTNQEKFILEQVEKGRIANLKEKFGEEEEKREIRAKFLEELLTGNFDAIKVHRRGGRLSHAVITGSLNLENAEIPYDVSIIDSHFRSNASFRDAFFKQHLVLNRTTFAKNADFHRLMVGKAFFCRDAVFQGAVNFASADIKGQLSADGAKFENKEQKANFNTIKVGQSAFFIETVFQGQVDFGSADIGRQFNAKGAKFQGEGEKNMATFNSMKVGDVAFFGKAVCYSYMDFSMIVFGKNFEAPEAKFFDRANFNSVKVGNYALFRKTEFHGEVSFRYADIAGLFAEEAKIFNEEKTADFTGLRIRQNANFEDACFNGPVVLVGADIIGQFIANGAHFEAKADLRYSSFQFLNLERVTWRNPKNVLLEGLTYQEVSAGEGKDDWKKLLAWIEGSRFNTQNYSQLEAYFSRCGDRDRADKVFISGKREAAKRLPWWKKWPIKFFWGGLAGYGRKPYYALPYMMLAILIGAIAFSLDFDTIKTPVYLKQAVDKYPLITKFILSLDRFLPGVDLGVAKHWQPGNCCLLSWLYWYIQKLLGWILMPIALAAIYTRIK